MLGTIRDKASGWVAGIIVGALVISFAFWGVSSYFGQGGDINVASVNGTDIKYKAFQESFYTLRSQMQTLLDDKALTLEEEEFVKNETLKRLVDTEVLNQVIVDGGLRLTDSKLVEKIRDLEYFKNNEKFDQDQYERTVMGMGMQPVVFEAQMRLDLLTEQLQAGLSESIFVLETELNDVLRLKAQTRDITYSVLSLTPYIDKEAEIPDAEIEAYYKANADKFADSEKVKIEYLELDVNELAKTVTAEEDKLREYYNDNKAKYDVTEQRSVEKLFVKFAEDATEEDKAQAKEVITAANTLVKEGKAFEEVLEKFSEEGKGALEFSEHAFMARAVMEKEIDEFLFSADEQEISEPIQTKTSFSIVKVGEIRGGPKNVYETVAERVAKDYKKEEAQLQFFELYDQLTNLSYEHSDTLEVAADALGQQTVESDFFARDAGAEGVLANDKVIASSFDPELISNGQNSEAIEISDNHVVVLRVLEHQPVSTKPLSVVKNEVTANIWLDKAEEKIKAFTGEITEQLKSGVATEKIAEEKDVVWTTVENVARDDINVNRAVLREAFQAGKPEAGKPIILSHRLGSGDYAIALVTAVHEGQITEDETKVKNFDLELRRNRGTAEWQEFLKNARSNADVKLFKENI